ncbi:MAG: sodium:calcium antiporter, partial [Armatimonadota bacterium]
AAVGTALPETSIPIVAIIMGGEGSHEVGLGAILGAPFLLGTLAFAMVGIAAIAYARQRPTGRMVKLRRPVVLRDMRYFVLVYGLAIAWALRPGELGQYEHLKWIVAVVLCVAYIRYVSVYLRSPGDMGEIELHPLRFSPQARDPHLWIVLLQVATALGGILVGARLFVDGIQALAAQWSIGPGVLALIIAPIATELPEKFNSVIWMRRGRDTLAMGNITGAMVFQSCLPPAIGICFTAWHFRPVAEHAPALASVAAALLSGLALMAWMIRRERLSGQAFLGALTLYAGFIVVLVLWWRDALPLPTW